VVALDFTRLTRIGTPETAGRHSDWDQIGKTYSALRGVGYVTCIRALEAQNLLDGSAMFAALGMESAACIIENELGIELLHGNKTTPKASREPARTARQRDGMSV